MTAKQRMLQIFSMLFYVGSVVFGLWFLFALVTSLASSTKSLDTWEGFFSLFSLGFLAIGLSFRNAYRGEQTAVAPNVSHVAGDIISHIVGKLMMGAAIVLIILGIAFIVIGFHAFVFTGVVGLGMVVLGVVFGIIALAVSGSNKRNQQKE